MRKFLSLFLIIMMAFATISCDRNEGPVEEAAESVDEAIEDAGDAVEDTAEEVGDKIEEAQEEVEDEVDDATDDN